MFYIADAVGLSEERGKDMKKRVLTVMVVMLVLSSALFAAGKTSRIQNYVSLNGGVDIGWHTDKQTVAGVTVSQTTVTDYIPLRVDGVNYFGNYVGITYGIGLNIPFAMWVGDAKTENVFDVMPVEFAVRAGIIGRYPVSKNFAVGGRFGVSFNGGMIENTTYGVNTKTMITRIDLTLGALCEFAFSDSLGLVAGFDVSFPAAAFRDVTVTSGGSSTTTKSRPDYKRFGIAPYIGIAFAY